MKCTKSEILCVTVYTADVHTFVLYLRIKEMKQGNKMERSAREKKTAFVVIFSAVTMVLEIGFGWFTHSMALLADGIHMGSHVLAIGLSWGAYVLVRRLEKRPSTQTDTDKVLSLSAYTSGILLLLFALFIIVEAVERFLFLPYRYSTLKPWW